MGAVIVVGLILGAGYLALKGPKPKTDMLVKGQRLPLPPGLASASAQVVKKSAGEMTREELIERYGTPFVPSGGGALSGALSAGSSAVLGAAKSYADTKTGGAVSSAETKIKSGNTVGAAGSFNAGITVAQPKK